MRWIARCVAVAVLVGSCIAAGEGEPPLELTLKLEMEPDDPLSRVMQWPFRSASYYLIVKGGEAFLSQTEEPAREVDKRAGNVDISFRVGINPVTRKFGDPKLQIAFRHVGPGWAADRFITDLVVPFSLPTKLGDTAVFSDTASMTVTWEVRSQGNVRTIADPMDVRFEQTLKCTTIRSNFSPKTR